MERFIIGGLIIAGVIFTIYYSGLKKGKQEEVVKQQEQVIEKQNEVIKEQKQVHIRQVKNKRTSIDDDISWLQNNICTDCR